MPMKMAPGTFLIIKIKVTTKPKTVKRVAESENEPSPTRVDLLATINPPCCRPKNAINKPIPAEIAYFRFAGIASIIFSRNLKMVIKTKINEATNTAAKAVCQLTPIPITTVYEKNALIPSAGAVAIGYFANTPMIIEPRALARAVAVKTAP